MIHKWEIPIKTVSELNISEHWTKKAKRHRQQKFFVQRALKCEIGNVSLPCTVRLTRLSERELDFVNLCASLKWVEDATAELLIPGLAAGRADGDPRIKTSFHQEKSKRQMVRIEIQSQERG